MQPKIGWFEIHAENYMGSGGPPHHWLNAIADLYPLSIHGVGLSLGGFGHISEIKNKSSISVSSAEIDPVHLMRFGQLVARYQPAYVSEHLAWSSHGGIYFNDLFPLPYHEASLTQTADNIARLQDLIQRPILIENPATYLRFSDDQLQEPDFLSALVSRTGCELLLDLNNVYISAINHGFDPAAWLARIPEQAIGEIHLAGHAEDLGQAHTETTPYLLIDTHDRPVSAAVWDLYTTTIARIGPCPTLIEWDQSLPSLDILLEQATRAAEIIQTSVRSELG